MATHRNSVLVLTNDPLNAPVIHYLSRSPLEPITTDVTRARHWNHPAGPSRFKKRHPELAAFRWVRVSKPDGIGSEAAPLSQQHKTAKSPAQFPYSDDVMREKFKIVKNAEGLYDCPHCERRGAKGFRSASAVLGHFSAHRAGTRKPARNAEPAAPLPRAHRAASNAACTVKLPGGIEVMCGARQLSEVFRAVQSAYGEAEKATADIVTRSRAGKFACATPSR